MSVPDSHPYRVVVADDNQIFRTSLVRFLGTIPNLEIVAQAVNGEEALQYVEKLAPLAASGRANAHHGWH